MYSFVLLLTCHTFITHWSETVVNHFVISSIAHPRNACILSLYPSSSANLRDEKHFYLNIKAQQFYLMKIQLYFSNVSSNIKLKLYIGFISHNSLVTETIKFSVIKPPNTHKVNITFIKHRHF